MAYLSRDIIAGFDKYKYNAIDTSPLSTYVCHPFWNWFVQFYPRWFAPNAITLAGYLLLVLQFVVLTYYDMHFYASDDSHPEVPPCPNWIWLFSAMCMFWAHTLDGTDGKQARRVGCCSPMGELFDHGLDSWATLWMPVCMFSMFGRSVLPVERIYLVLIGVMVTFIFSHWEKYNTGILYLPWSYDMSQLGLVTVYGIGFIYGYKLWKSDVPFFGIPFGELFEIFMQLSVWCVSLPVSVWNVYKSYKNKTGKRLSLYENLRPFCPVLWEFALFMIWTRWSSFEILRRQPRLYFVASGTVFSNIACRLIVSGMSNTRCQAFNWLLVPLLAIVIGVLTLNLGIIEVYLLWAYTIFAVAAHVHYGISVVQQLADHFNIYVFSVEKPPPRKKSD